MWWKVIVVFVFFFSSRRRHTRLRRDWSSDVCSSDLKKHVCDDFSGGYRAGSRGALNLESIEILSLWKFFAEFSGSVLREIHPPSGGSETSLRVSGERLCRR